MYNAILSAGLVTVSAPNTNVKGDIETTKVRYEICPGYRIWCHETFKAEERGLISKTERIEMFTIVKDACINNYNNEVLKQTTQVAEVVVDEIALLKAELAAKTQECAKVVRELNVTKTELTVSEAKVNQYEAVLSRLQKRTVVIGNVVTKVYTQVAQSVGF